MGQIGERNTSDEERAAALANHVDVDIVPTGKPFSLEGTTSGFWFADGTFIFLAGSCDHVQLFKELHRRSDLADRPERVCETLMALWETGCVRVMTASGVGWRIDFRGYYEPTLARFKEWFDWLGPDKARMTEVILDVVEKGTDVDLAYFQGTAEQAYAWMLMGCPHHGNRRPKSGGQGVCNNARKPNSDEVRTALKAAGVPWAR